MGNILNKIAASKVFTTLINVGMMVGAYYLTQKNPDLAPIIATAFTGANGLAPSTLLASKPPEPIGGGQKPPIP